MSSTLTAPKMKLKTGLDPLERVHIKDTRGLSFHGMGAFVGTGRTQRAHVYTAASIPVDPEAYKKIDPEKLARRARRGHVRGQQRPLLDDRRVSISSSAKSRTSTASRCGGPAT